MKIIVIGKFPNALSILKKVDAELLGSAPKFQVNTEIQLNTARVSRLSSVSYDYGRSQQAFVMNLPHIYRRSHVV